MRWRQFADVADSMAAACEFRVQELLVRVGVARQREDLHGVGVLAYTAAVPFEYTRFQ